MVELQRITTSANVTLERKSVAILNTWAPQGIIVRALVEARKTNPTSADVHILAIVHVRAMLCDNAESKWTPVK